MDWFLYDNGLRHGGVKWMFPRPINEINRLKVKECQVPIEKKADILYSTRVFKFVCGSVLASTTQIQRNSKTSCCNYKTT